MEFNLWSNTVGELARQSRLGHAVALILPVNLFKPALKTMMDVLGTDIFDVKELAPKEGESKIKIDATRSWINSLQLSARGKKGTLGVVLGADLLTDDSASTLLKTIEEPPKNTTILLLATRDNLIPTIRSRVSQFDIDPAVDQTASLVDIPDTVSGIIKIADKWHAQKESQAKLASILQGARTAMKQGNLSPWKVDAIQDAVSQDDSGLNQKLLVEGVLLDYDK